MGSRGSLILSPARQGELDHMSSWLSDSKLKRGAISWGPISRKLVLSVGVSPSGGGRVGVGWEKEREMLGEVAMVWRRKLLIWQETIDWTEGKNRDDMLKLQNWAKAKSSSTQSWNNLANKRYAGTHRITDVQFILDMNACQLSSGLSFSGR